MQSVSFKIIIIYSLATVLIVFLLTVTCDFKYSDIAKIKTTENMNFEDEQNVSMSKLGSQPQTEGKYKYE